MIEAPHAGGLNTSRALIKESMPHYQDYPGAARAAGLRGVKCGDGS